MERDQDKVTQRNFQAKSRREKKLEEKKKKYKEYLKLKERERSKAALAPQEKISAQRLNSPEQAAKSNGKARKEENPMTRKSDSCISSHSNKPLTEYNSEYEAQDGADYAKSKYKNNNLVPYKCDKCGLWHLSPQKCQICTDSNGGYKVLYLSKVAAKKRARISFEEKGMRLRAYQCPHHRGWHLTKS